MIITTGQTALALLSGAKTANAAAPSQASKPVDLGPAVIFDISSNRAGEPSAPGNSASKASAPKTVVLEGQTYYVVDKNFHEKALENARAEIAKSEKANKAQGEVNDGRLIMITEENMDLLIERGRTREEVERMLKEIEDSQTEIGKLLTVTEADDAAIGAKDVVSE